MAKISFNVSARTARLIGQENFANADGAVIELVKNSYDADASDCIIFFETSNSDLKKQKIFIIDNGQGMTDSIIKNHWMMIGTDIKELEYTTISGRIKTGAKGIGRFALDRLGEICEMYTLPKGEHNGFYWKVSWVDFERKKTAISNVKADLNNLHSLDLKSQLLSLTNSFPQLASSLEKIRFSNGTILVITGLHEKWEDEDIKKLFSNLEILIPPREQTIFSIHLFSKENPDEYGELSSTYFDDYDYMLAASFLNDEKQTVKIKICRNELDFEQLRSKYSDVFKLSKMNKFPYDFLTFEKGSFEYTKTLTELVKGSSEEVPISLLKRIGPFDFSFYFLKNTKSDDKSIGEYDVEKKYPYKSFNSSNRKAWLNRYGGIKIFRDDFRVRPYGEPGNDWLELGKRLAQSRGGPGQRLGGYRIGPNQISGTISISRVKNSDFQDKSNREGIRENPTFQFFKEVLIGIIAEFEKDRNFIMYNLSEFYDNREKEAKANREAEEIAKKIIEEADTDKHEPQKLKTTEKPGREHTKEEIALARNIETKKGIIHEKDEEIRLLRGLAGIGLIVASFAHELRGLRTLLTSRSQDLKNILLGIINEETIKKLPVEDNPITILNQMREQDIHIKQWLDYSLTALKRDRRTRTNVDISEYFSTFRSNWASALQRRKVSISLENKLSRSIYIRAFPIDLDTVFNNLLANSLDSFKRMKDGSSRNIHIIISSSNNYLLILFGDNGAGLSKDFTEPTDIFLPFETSKVDNRGNKIGTGMGMFLVKSIIDEYDGKIDLKEINDGFKIQIAIPFRKNTFENE